MTITRCSHPRLEETWPFRDRDGLDYKTCPQCGHREVCGTFQGFAVALGATYVPGSAWRRVLGAALGRGGAFLTRCGAAISTFAQRFQQRPDVPRGTSGGI